MYVADVKKNQYQMDSQFCSRFERKSLFKTVGKYMTKKVEEALQQDPIERANEAATQAVKELLVLFRVPKEKEKVEEFVKTNDIRLIPNFVDYYEESLKEYYRQSLDNEYHKKIIELQRNIRTARFATVLKAASENNSIGETLKLAYEYFFYGEADKRQRDEIFSTLQNAAYSKILNVTKMPVKNFANSVKMGESIMFGGGGWNFMRAERVSGNQVFLVDGYSKRTFNTDSYIISLVDPVIPAINSISRDIKK